MNYIKAQKEVFSALVSGRSSVGGFDIDENYMLVTPDGFKAFIFPSAIIAFCTEKIKPITPFPIAELIKPENELELTADLRILDEHGKRIARRLRGMGKNVYINTKFLDCFQNPKFYQDKSNISIVVVTESGNPVGIILPIRATFDDGTYYNDRKDVTA